jgi:hypothetical protein
MALSRFTLLPKILLILIVIVTAARPSDGPWVNDEPIMMEMALRYNHTASSIYGIPLPFTPCPFGLVGTHGLRYGPLPIWLDQLFLAFTHDVVVMLAIRALLFSALTAIAVYLFAKTLGLSTWFAVVTMLSPWLWNFSRSLWDSTWCIPISALLLASYAKFLTDRKTAPLIIAAFCCIILPSIHLMGIPLVIPVLGHALVFHRREIWNRKWRLAAGCCICAYCFWPYIFYLFTHLTPANQSNVTASRGWVYTIFGGHFLTLGILGTSPGDGWQDEVSASIRLAGEICRWISLPAILAVWAGIFLAIPRAWTVIVNRSSKTIDHLCLIALLVWVCQTILDVSTRLYYAPHYYSGTWIAYVFFAWLAADWLRMRCNPRFFIPSIGGYSASLVAGIAIIAASIAIHGGTRSTNYGLSLGNQIAAVEQLRQYAPETMDIEVPQWRRYPRAWQVLMELAPPQTIPARQLPVTVNYRDPNSRDAHIEVTIPTH